MAMTRAERIQALNEQLQAVCRDAQQTLSVPTITLDMTKVERTKREDAELRSWLAERGIANY